MTITESPIAPQVLTVTVNNGEYYAKDFIPQYHLGETDKVQRNKVYDIEQLAEEHSRLQMVVDILIENGLLNEEECNCAYETVSTERDKGIQGKSR